MSLLLQLIEHHQLAVTQISVVAVADQFLALVNDAGMSHDLGTIGEFISMAARLLQIKSRALLRLPVSQIDDGAESDDAEALARQIVAYRSFQGAAEWLAARRTSHLQTMSRPPQASTPLLSPCSPVIVPQSLQRAARRLLGSPPVMSVRTELWPDVDYMALRADLLQAVSRRNMVTFEQLCRGAWHPLVVITLFLALLDAMRAQLLSGSQSGLFKPILISTRTQGSDDAG